MLDKKVWTPVHVPVLTVIERKGIMIRNVVHAGFKKNEYKMCAYDKKDATGA